MYRVRRIAYFTMEIGLETGMPTYSGGLGILAADTVRSAADLGVPMVAVTLLHRKGYFHQRLDDAGTQTEEPADWSVDDYLVEESTRAAVKLEGHDVSIRAWRYDVKGIGGSKVPVYFLDTDLPENLEQHRALTQSLYGNDMAYRVRQEAILGIGGVRMLRALGYNKITRFHMNEGHAAFLTLELLQEKIRETGRDFIEAEDLEEIRQWCVFTTHTPVPAGHDQFPVDLVKRVIGEHPAFWMEHALCLNHTFNMTYLALTLSHYVNGVAKKHGEVSSDMYPTYEVDSITNGVHAASWASEPFQRMFDKHIPGWREDNFSLRYALSIPRQEIWEAHREAKKDLVERVNREANAGMDRDVFTLGFARRATPYKRGDLLFHDIERLRRISRERGPIQLVFAGKAHPRDDGGKNIIRRIFEARKILGTDVRVAFLVNYDRDLGRLITAGVDVWLNTPQPPMEASGTSGMKAALNGVPSLSVLDGWWIEGHIEGVTGWSIGKSAGPQEGNTDSAVDARDLYDKLENTILPLWYNDRNRFVDIMLHAVALNGSFFNTQRMVQQYVLKAYFL